MQNHFLHSLPAVTMNSKRCRVPSIQTGKVNSTSDCVYMQPVWTTPPSVRLSSCCQLKTPLISLSSPHVIPRPGCCALDHSYLTDGRKCPVLCNCVQIKELRCDEAFVLVSVHRGAEFQTAVKHRKFKRKSSSCLNYTTVAHVNKVKRFDYFRLFDVSNVLALKISN